jgi:hypothetical protein
MADKPKGGILTTQASVSPIRPFAALTYVQEKFGVSIWTQLRQILALALGPGKLSAEEYFYYALYRPDLTKDQRNAYISRAQCLTVNKRLTPEGLENHGALLKDKVLTETLLGALGLPVGKTRAIYSRSHAYGMLPTLSARAEVLGFLKSPEAVPCFGKPTGMSRSVGTVAIVGRSDGGALVLGDGKEVTPEALADEIVEKFPKGYIFQDLITQSPEVIRIAGTAVSSLRIVTVIEPEGPAVLYVKFRMAAPGAMNDANGRVNIEAAIDPRTGIITAAHHGIGLMTGGKADLSTTGAQKLIGYELPDFARAIEICLAAHRVVGDHGIIGWDVALSDKGPLINEANTSPHHVGYQLSHDRGFLSPDIKNRLDRVQAFAEEKAEARKIEREAKR